MMKPSYLTLAAGALVLAAPASAQDWTSQNPVLQRIWQEGMHNSQVETLAQALLDSIGPRLTGAPGKQAAHDWTVARYAEWGIPARNEQYGTWTGWQRGITHVDLVAPRVRSLEGQMLAWSPGTSGPVTGGVVVLPDLPDAAAFQAWLPSVAGRFVLVSAAEATCRPLDNWEEWGLPATFERIRDARTENQRAWQQRVQRTGHDARTLPLALEDAGAAGVITSFWSGGWGVNRIFQARTQRVPTLDLSCEDYGLVYRLSENDQGPELRVNATAEFLGEVPALNTLAELRGRQRPNEYVVLSAHFDSWDGASGATDNGTGTVVMMEAMRILRQLYPTPRRTIMAGHWGGEEQGLNGSRGFVADNPQIVRNVHVLFNQDNGTGRIARVSMQGFLQTEPRFRQWFERMPEALVGAIEIQSPGAPSTGGTDNASFVCAGAPAFTLSSLSWDYGTYTWHTNRDTYDKISFDDVRMNATIVAMLAYLAAEEPQMLPRERRTDLEGGWPECREPARSHAQSPR
jgi:carboxypeptidase Q